MNAEFEAALRKHLRQKGEPEVTIDHINAMGDHLQNNQDPLSPREWLHFLYTVRLEGALERQPNRPDIHSKLRSILSAVEATLEDEPIFSWEAATPTRSLSRIIVHGPDIFPHQRSVQARVAANPSTSLRIVELWVVRPLNHFPSDCENRKMNVLKSLAYSSYH